MMRGKWTSAASIVSTSHRYSGGPKDVPLRKQLTWPERLWYSIAPLWSVVLVSLM